MDQRRNDARARLASAASLTLTQLHAVTESDAEALLELGISLCRRARWREAIDPLQRAIGLDPNKAAAHYQLGETYNQTDRLTEALEAYETAARLQPDNWRAMKGIGIVLDRMGKPEAATAAYQRASDAQKQVMSKRAMVGGPIIVAWLAGLALLVRREYFRPQYEKLAEAAMRITPGVVYYGVMQGDKQVGFASSTIDTAQTSLTITDYFVADIPVGGKARRASARSNVTLSRALHCQDVRPLDRERRRADSRRRAPSKATACSFSQLTTGRDEGRTRSASRSPDRCSCRRSCRSRSRSARHPKVGKHYTSAGLRSDDDDAEGGRPRHPRRIDLRRQRQLGV